MLKWKKQYLGGYVDRKARKIERRGRHPARYAVPRLRPILAASLPAQTGASGSQVVAELENTAGVQGMLDERTVLDLFTRKRLASLKKAEPIADALQTYCKVKALPNGQLMEVYDAALPPEEANRAIRRLANGSTVHPHVMVADSAGLHTEVVRTLCNGHVAPSRVVSHVAAAMAALGGGTLVPVGWHTITWPRHVVPELSARDNIETWLETH